MHECQKLLTPQNIRRIAKAVVQVAESYEDNSEFNRLKGLLKETQKAKRKMMASLRVCSDDTVREMIFNDLSKIGAEIKELEKQLEIEEARRQKISESSIIKFLTNLAKCDINNNTVYRRSLIRIFVNKIFLYDDKFTIIFNTGDDETTVSDILLADIEKELEGQSLCLSTVSGHQ